MGPSATDRTPHASLHFSLNLNLLLKCLSLNVEAHAPSGGSMRRGRWGPLPPPPTDLRGSGDFPGEGGFFSD
jgi:hypothetical protein